MAEPMIQNPIVRGFNPDPSICRAGEDYYMACSTFEYFPGVQIHHSRDLRHWRLLTRALDSKEMLDLSGVDNSCGVWAPQLTYCDGLFYLIFANVSGVGGPVTDSPTFLTTAKSISGPWSKPVYLRSGGFDPSLFHDADGRKYYVNMQMGEPGGGRRFDGIWLQEYDAEKQKLVGDFRKIWDGTRIGVTEGPHLYRRDGFYYLLTAEGGTSWNHAVSVARSRNLRGPYETMPDNPLMTCKEHLEWPLQTAGHADIVETPDGELFMVHLAQRPMGVREIGGETRRIVPLGRESCIQRLSWPVGDWPRLAGGGKLPQLRISMPDLPESPFPALPVRTDFRQIGELPVNFVTLREPLTADWCRLTGGGLELRGGESLNSRFHQSWVGRRLQHDAVRVETTVRFAPPTFRETAGLIAYYDRMNFLYLRLAGNGAGRVKVGVIASDNGVVSRYDAAEFPVETPFFRLRLVLAERRYQFAFAAGDGAWQAVDCSFPITQLGDNASRFSCFTGTMVGICAQAVSGMDCRAVFEYFDYEEIEPAKFRDTALPLEERIDSLLSALTVEEKLGFLNYRNEGVERLGIPPYVWWNEALHGLARSGSATVFPQAIGMAAIFSPELVERMGRVIAKEGRARHADAARHGDFGTYKGLTYWSPNVNIFRDPRWGRGQETYGECPFLTGLLGAAYVRGVQGPDPEHLDAVATPKHFAVHSGPEKTRLEFDSKVGERDLRETYLRAFHACIQAGAQSIMSAYNGVNGTPCSVNRRLLQDILRGEWKFDGAVVTDAGAGEALVRDHKRCADYPAATAEELKSGVDVITDWEQGVREAYRRGLIGEPEIDRALRNQLRVKFRLGLFDPPREEPSCDVIECREHLQTALEASRRSMVLLKNAGGVLPLKRETLRSIAVIGPNAESFGVLVGNYYGTPTRYTTFLAGIADAVGEGCRVLYARGCEPAALRTEACAEDYDRIAEAVSAAERADAVVLLVGLNPQLEGEAGDTFNVEAAGDKLSLDLPGLQPCLVEKVRRAASGKPVVLVSVSGSALALPVDNADAVIQCFYPGAQGGRALAELLFGAYSPSGRLPVTFYRGTADLPPFDDYAMANRTYRFFKGEVLFPFGFGLSYTTFEYGIPECTPEIPCGETLPVTCLVRNTGKVPSEEVVQLYVASREAKDGAPLRELAAVRRIALMPGEAQKVSLPVPAEAFLTTLDSGERIFQNGLWKIGVGPDSVRLQWKNIEVL